jgi:serine/threonine-protein kinase PRP4
MVEERDAKRLRLDDDVIDDKDLQSLLDGDAFVSQAEREEAEAERRRAQRRERLRRIAQERDDMEGVSKEEKIATVTGATKEEEQNEQHALPQQDAAAHPVSEKEPPGESGTESFDMFSSTPPPPQSQSSLANNNNDKKLPGNSVGASQRGQEQQDFDDEEGYYTAVIGETIELELHDNSSQSTSESLEPIRLRVDGLIGRGVFSTVLKVTTISNSSSHAIPPTAAVKMIRSNETMAKAALNEIRFLHQLRGSRGIIPLLFPTTVNPMEHRGHVMLVFPHLEYNMRDLLQKFGKGVGLSLSAVRSYFGQLISALTHLKRRGIIHADLKPDNILIDGDFTTVHLADFGSAFEANSTDNQPTPYMVSRFYRAPEIILGLTPTIAIDLWSLAVSIAELFLGNVLFHGKSNNDMLYVFMQHLGAFSNRIVRQHIVQLSRIPSLARQFQVDGSNYVFLQQTVDSVTGASIHNKLPLVSTPTTHSLDKGHKKFPSATPLSQKILRAKSANDSRTQVLQFVDLLQKCLALDPGRRIALKDALGHDFFRVTDAASSRKNDTLKQKS